MNKDSPEYIGWLLATNDRAVERALVCLYNRQTIDEQLSEDTKHRNGRGFSAGEGNLHGEVGSWWKAFEWAMAFGCERNGIQVHWSIG